MALTDLDHQHSQEAWRIGYQHRGWLVMWSVWHRRFTAFCCFSPVPLLIEAPTAAELTAHLRRAEQHYTETPADPRSGRFPPNVSAL
jgi:hypothetical protein